VKTGVYVTRKDEKTAQIIQAATREFLNKGLDAASMHNIAETAEVSKRTLYKYFHDKDELYSALVDELLDRVHDMYQLSYSPDIPIKQQLEKIVDNKIGLTTSESFLNMSRIVIGEMLKSRMLSEDQLARMNNSETLFVEWIDEAKKDKKINSEMDSKIIADQFHSIMKGQVFFPVLFGFVDLKTIDKKEVRDMTVNFFMNSFCD
jgi:TetR/AcrR family transcriptional regulator of autoinduction and epiphytic fitness